MKHLLLKQKVGEVAYVATYIDEETDHLVTIEVKSRRMIVGHEMFDVYIAADDVEGKEVFVEEHIAKGYHEAAWIIRNIIKKDVEVFYSASISYHNFVLVPSEESSLYKTYVYMKYDKKFVDLNNLSEVYADSIEEFIEEHCI